MSSQPRPSAPTLAYLSAPGPISLPSPLLTGAATKSNERLRPHRAARQAAEAHDRGNAVSTARVMVGAAAVTAAKTFVLDVKHSHWHDAHNGLGGWKDEGDNGGVALLVMALCLGRAVMEMRRLLKDRKKNGRDRVAGPGSTATRSRILWSVSAAVQVMAYFLAVKAVGPIRASILAAMATIFAPLFLVNSVHPKTTGRNSVSLLPGILACGFVMFDAHKRHGSFCLFTLTTLLLTTIALCGPLSAASAPQIRNADIKRDTADRSWGRLADGAMFCVACTAGVVALSFAGIASPPHLILATSATNLALPLLTALIIVYCPLPITATGSVSPAAQLRSVRSWAAHLLTILTLQFFALHPRPGPVDALVLLPSAILSLYLSPSNPSIHDTGGQRKPSSKDVDTKQYTPTHISTSSGGISLWSLLPSAWRPHLRTILHTDSSRKIFYFLLINLAYMGVQLGYGVYTNSLGLISDAIHMFFDCLGIGVGLWASIAATWKPDGRYTFGYGRVETLSGFANGLFLILISIFIVFEGIQRILNPPEMRTQQLLLVSSIGLGINLFGMWATGGHHHHGHSHGHDHGHGHGHSHAHGSHGHADHSHAHVHAKKEDHSHDHDHCDNDHRHHNHSDGSDCQEQHGNDHQHHHDQGSHSRKSSADVNAIRPGMDQIRKRTSQHFKDAHHTHSHSHSHPHSHEHSHSDLDHHHADHSQDRHCHGHGHQHGHDPHHDHSHSHSHSHSHHDHGHSHNMRGVFLHVMADTLGSVGVIISTIMIKYTGWTIFDPIASLFIALLIMASVIPLVVACGRVLCLDVGADVERDIKTALTEISNVPGLASFSAPRIWPRNEGDFVCSLHIQLALSESAYGRDSITGELKRHTHGQPIYANADRVVKQVKQVLRNRVPGLSEIVVQVEGSEEGVFCDCMTGAG